MSVIARVRGAWKLVLLGLALRVSLALAAGLVPAAWASQATRSFPRGELALTDRGGLVLFDVFAHGSSPYGAGSLSLALGGVVVAIGLLPFGALVFAVREPGRVMPLLARSLARMGTSLLLSGIALLVLGLVVLIEAMAFGPLVQSLGRKSLLAPIACLLLALPAPALFALLGDALRIRGLLAEDRFIERFEATWRCVRPRLAATLARYAFAALVQAVSVLAASALVLAVVARPPGLFAVGLAGAAFLLVIAAFTRAWLVGHVAVIVEPAGPDLEALHGSRDVGYEAARTVHTHTGELRDVSPDSSVGRAED